MATPEFDASRARLKEPDWFERFRVTGDGSPLKRAGLKQNVQLILIECGGQKRAFVREQIGYDHAAQGELAGQPYVISC